MSDEASSATLTERVVTDRWQRAENAATMKALRGGLTREQANEAVRLRDGNRCRRCGMTDDEHVRQFGARLEVHRVNPGSVYDPAACLLLCRPCHGTQPKKSRGETDLENEPSAWLPGYASREFTCDDPGDWVTVAEARDLVGDVTTRRIQALAAKKTVRSVKVLGRLLLDRKELIAWRDGPRKRGRPPKPKPPAPGKRRKP